MPICHLNNMNETPLATHRCSDHIPVHIPVHMPERSNMYESIQRHTELLAPWIFHSLLLTPCFLSCSRLLTTSRPSEREHLNVHMAASVGGVGPGAAATAQLSTVLLPCCRVSSEGAAYGPCRAFSVLWIWRCVRDLQGPNCQ